MAISNTATSLGGARTISANYGPEDFEKLDYIMRNEKLANTFFGTLARTIRVGGTMGSPEPMINQTAELAAEYAHPPIVRAWENKNPYADIFNDRFLRSIKQQPNWWGSPVPSSQTDVEVSVGTTKEAGANEIELKEMNQAPNKLSAKGTRLFAVHNITTMVGELFGLADPSEINFATAQFPDPLLRNMMKGMNNIYKDLDDQLWAYIVGSIRKTKDNELVDGINPATYSTWHNQVVAVSDHAGSFLKAADAACSKIGTEGTADARYVILAPQDAAEKLSSEIVGQGDRRTMVSPNDPNLGFRDIYGFSLTVAMQSFNSSIGPVPIITWYNRGSDATKAFYILDLARLGLQIGVTNQKMMLPRFGNGFAFASSSTHTALDWRAQSVALLCPESKQHTAVVHYS